MCASAGRRVCSDHDVGFTGRVPSARIDPLGLFPLDARFLFWVVSVVTRNRFDRVVLVNWGQRCSNPPCRKRWSN
jgi:hypothetical protein